MSFRPNVHNADQARKELVPKTGIKQNAWATICKAIGSHTGSEISNFKHTNEGRMQNFL